MKEQKITYEILKANGRLRITPSHEIEELLSIHIDDFDQRKRRGGYPDSDYYKDFSAQKAGEEKLLAERISRADLNEFFVFWKLAIPSSHLTVMILFGAFALISLIAWPVFAVMGDFYKAYCSFVFAVCSCLIVWITNKYKFFSKDPRKYYEEMRVKDFREVPVLR